MASESIREEPPLLGYLDGKIQDELKGVDNHKWTKFGGQPLFPVIVDSNELNQLVSQLVCVQCNNRLTFVGQIFCPLALDNHDRILYFFACDQLACQSDHWQVIRCVFPPVQNTQMPTTTSGNLIGEDKNEFEEESWDELDDEPEMIELEDGQIKEHPTPVPALSGPPQFVTVDQFSGDKLIAYYVEAQAEDMTKKASSMNDKIKQLIEKYTQNSSSEEKASSSSSSASKQNEEFESIDETNILEHFNNDQMTYRFYKRIKLNPTQVLRYHWNQSPLINSSSFETPNSDCTDCGSKRVFEMQLMPALLNFLAYDKSNVSRNVVNYNKPTNLDFATVLVYTCASNCNSKPFHFENCVVLKETDLHLPETFAQQP